MESDRVEMSVGSGMVNGDHGVNGTATHGTPAHIKSQTGTTLTGQPGRSGPTPHTNGDVGAVKKEADGTSSGPAAVLRDVPPELPQALSSEFYLPMARLVGRSAQSCWNDLSRLVERLATMPVPAPNTQSLGASINDQSKVNLEKKDLLLNFAKDHKDKFIKLLVLLQWSKKSDDVRKTIELNLWIQQRRQAFNNATGMLGAMMRGLADAQVPNPDLHTAAEVLATGSVASMPKLDYVPHPPLSVKQTVRVLKRLDAVLCTRMALAEDLPIQLRQYYIHDGRLTFTVDHGFSFDVSVMTEEPDAKFGMVDFAFLFSPAPSIPDSLHDEIIYIANTALDKDGFAGVYDFLNDLTLSYKLSEYTKQARRLSQGLWAGKLRVEVLRRTLVVQYWLKDSGPKSWLEIGIHSGRRTELASSATAVPGIHLAWMREGTLTDTHEIHVDLSKLSIEDVLRQAIAQHTNHMFDAIYDKLSLSPPYRDADLELNQSSSDGDPAECVLDVQLSRADMLHVNIEPIGGSLILSPVSERTTRMQHDLARSNNVVDDFISRLTSLRSNTAEYNLMRSLPNSQWQRLEGIRISLAEAEKLFGHVTMRISFLRLQHWAQSWLLSVTQTATGDRWWLTQTVKDYSVLGARVTEIVKNHPLYLTGSPSPAYLERLAEYTTGAIALQSNAEYLSSKKFAWVLRDIPAFDERSRLPALQFSRSAHPQHKSLAMSLNSTNLFVHLTYHGVGRTSKQVVMVAKAALTAEVTVLRDLAASKLDQSVVIIPEKRQVMVRVETDAGTPVVDDVVSKLSHLENIVTCAASVNKSSEHVLQSLSLSSITILYHASPNLSLVINFGSHSDDLSADFLPADTNPQRHLSSWVAQTMKRQGRSSSRNLSHIFAVLRMTQPLMSYLQRLQSPSDPLADTSLPLHHQVRVHVLYRSPHTYGVHYFANSSNFLRDESDKETPTKLLARFEILANKRGDRLMWMIRPAIEEFNSYHRTSYTSNALRERISQGVFKKQSSSWLALDQGAACPSDKPGELLSAVHDTILAWVREAVKPDVAPEQSNTAVGGPVTNGSNDKKTVRPNATPTQKTQNTTQRTNSAQRSQQQPPQRPQTFNNNRKQFSGQTEVITLD